MGADKEIIHVQENPDHRRQEPHGLRFSHAETTCTAYSGRTDPSEGILPHMIMGAMVWLSSVGYCGMALWRDNDASGQK